MLCVCTVCKCIQFKSLNLLTPNDPYMGHTAPLTSKRYILYIYSTNIGTEYFKHALNAPFFSLQNAVCFIMLTCLVPVLFTFYIQGVLKLKKIIPAPKGQSISRHSIYCRNISLILTYKQSYVLTWFIFALCISFRHWLNDSDSWKRSIRSKPCLSLSLFAAQFPHTECPGTEPVPAIWEVGDLTVWQMKPL